MKFFFDQSLGFMEFDLKVEECVPIEDGRTLTCDDFRNRYLIPNKPVLITGLTEEWRACSEWISEDGKPDFEFLARNFGASNVQVADCSEREFTDQKRLNMIFLEFMDYWTSEKTSDKGLLYLKDWHFVKDYPNYGAYKTPIFFSDDWLNQYLDTGLLHVTDCTSSQEACSDYRFVYMGPKGTWTPLHADVFRSYSWSANLCGKKLWHLLPPEQTPLLYDRHRRNTVYDIYGAVSEVEFPGFSKTRWVECLQKAGEIIFVPSGWYHQVTNTEDVISINHNWFNACNLHWVWRLLLDDYKETVASIEDIRDICSDFEALCQRNLAANSGMNFKDFIVFINWRLDRVLGGCASESEPQASFDLACIRNVLQNMSREAAAATAFGDPDNEEITPDNFGDPWHSLRIIEKFLRPRSIPSSDEFQMPSDPPPQDCHV